MVQIFGHFINKAVKSKEFLMMKFSPSSTPLQQRWRNNGLSADFLADYLTTFFPNDDNDPTMLEKLANIKGAISYIANELLENAMKFNDNSFDYPVDLQFNLHNDHLMLCVTNNLPYENMRGFQSFIDELLNTDPEELYVRQIERAEENEGQSSGLGLLTIIDDYDAKLGWKFETIQQKDDAEGDGPSFLSFLKKFFSSSEKPKVTVVTTMVQLPI